MEFHSPRRSRSVPALEHITLSAERLDAVSHTPIRSRSPCRCQCTCHSATVNPLDFTSKNQRGPHLVTTAEFHQMFLDNESRRDQEAIEHRDMIWQDLEQRLALLPLTDSHSKDADDILRQKKELAREREALEAERQYLRASVEDAQRARDTLTMLTEIRELLVALFDSGLSDTTSHHNEIIDAIRATAQETASEHKLSNVNIQTYLDEFSRALATEVRVFISDLGKLREERRDLQHELGYLMSMKTKYGPGGEFDPDWTPSKRNSGRGPPPPPPPPPPEPPKVAKPAWRTVHPRPSRRTRKENRFPVPQPSRPPASPFHPSSKWGDTAWDGTAWDDPAWDDSAVGGLGWGLREKEHIAPFPPSEQSHKEVMPWAPDVKTRESDANVLTAPTALALLPSTPPPSLSSDAGLDATPAAGVDSSDPVESSTTGSLMLQSPQATQPVLGIHDSSLVHWDSTDNSVSNSPNRNDTTPTHSPEQIPYTPDDRVSGASSTTPTPPAWFRLPPSPSIPEDQSTNASLGAVDGHNDTNSPAASGSSPRTSSRPASRFLGFN